LTANGGLYLFDSLTPGEYYIKLTDLNEGIISSTGEGTTATITGAGTFEPAMDPDTDVDNNDDNGTQMGYGDTTMVMSDLVLLSLSDEPVDDGDADSTSNLSVDFGLLQTLSVGNLVWADANNDGLNNNILRVVAQMVVVQSPTNHLQERMPTSTIMTMAHK